MSVAYGRAFGRAPKFSRLYHDDALHVDPIVEKALTRIPEDVRNARNHRIIRATQLSLMQRILPKEEWTTFEDDQKNRYLWKAIHDVVKEIDEENHWDKKY
ncbi:cytochrome b-c1 complex subunit 7 isoform X2 [Bemisia tabaci]|uniref:cytochrome b-c1 complex subunit 7 isoform X2 n=1 Tax=Bemisia tabaci TaxID=7038 RepID=UPI003B282618